MNHLRHYRNNPDAIRALVDKDRVHRDVYLNEEIFDIECERLFAQSWVYIGHDSQIPKSGDYITTQITKQPVIMIRQPDGTIRVLRNRCAHKGAMVLSCPSGNTGKFLRCPYHAWTYRTDGKPLAVPLRADYEGTRLSQCESAKGLETLDSETYRGFVFARLASEGLSFAEYFGEMLMVLDNLADRSPAGKLQVAGGCMRNIVHCNWKIYLENVIDAVHANSTHESAWQTARHAAQSWPDNSPQPKVLEQLLPFGASYDFYQQAGARVYSQGHSILGTRASNHSGHKALAAYESALRQAHGEKRAQEVLAFSPQNSVLFPSMAIKSSPQTLRVIRPLAANRTLVEVFALAPLDAPKELLQQTLAYNRLVFSPMSMVAHDDLHVFETMQRALASGGNPWVSLHRGYQVGESEESCMDVGGNNEILMRNQFKAWANLMAPLRLTKRNDGAAP